MSGFLGNVVGFVVGGYVVVSVLYGIYLSVTKDPGGAGKAFAWPLAVYKHFRG